MLVTECCRRGVEVAGSALALTWDRMLVEDEHLAVLGSSRGGGRRCPAQVKALLVLDKTGRHWQPHDFLKDGVPKDEWDENEKVWVATLDGVLKEMVPPEQHSAMEPTPAAVLKFIAFARSPLDAKDEPKPASKGDALKKLEEAAEDSEPELMEDAYSTDESSDEETVKVSRKAARAALKKAAKGKDAALTSNQMKLDLAMHPGATSGKQLSYLSACVFLGRHATREEVKGSKYGEHPVSSALIRKNSKVAALGMQGITPVFSHARRLNSVAPLTQFFSNTRDKMICAPDDHCQYAQMGAHRIGAWYDKGIQAAPNDAVAIEYFELAVVRWPMNGRGMPVDFEGELMERAKRLVMESEAEAPCTPPRVGVAAVHSPSASHVPKPPPSGPNGADVMALVGEQMETLVKSMESVSASVQQLGRRVDGTHTKMDGVTSKLDSLTSRVQSLETKSKASLTKAEKDKTITCNKCGQVGHREADCPN